MNNNLEIRIKIHEIQKDLKERVIFDQKNDIEKLFAEIEELKDEKDFNQRLKNQDVKKQLNEYKEEIMRLNKIVNDKDEVLTQIQNKLKDQESEVYQCRQQIKLLQLNDNSKTTHKFEISKSNKALSNNFEEIFRLKNHN